MQGSQRLASEVLADWQQAVAVVNRCETEAHGWFRGSKPALDAAAGGTQADKPNNANRFEKMREVRAQLEHASRLAEEARSFRDSAAEHEARVAAAVSAKQAAAEKRMIEVAEAIDARDATARAQEAATKELREAQQELEMLQRAGEKLEKEKAEATAASAAVTVAIGQLAVMEEKLMSIQQLSLEMEKLGLEDRPLQRASAEAERAYDNTIGLVEELTEISKTEHREAEAAQKVYDETLKRRDKEVKEAEEAMETLKSLEVEAAREQEEAECAMAQEEEALHALEHERELATQAKLAAEAAEVRQSIHEQAVYAEVRPQTVSSRSVQKNSTPKKKQPPKPKMRHMGTFPGEEHAAVTGLLPAHLIVGMEEFPTQEKPRVTPKKRVQKARNRILQTPEPLIPPKPPSQRICELWKQMENKAMVTMRTIAGTTELAGKKRFQTLMPKRYSEPAVGLHFETTSSTAPSIGILAHDRKLVNSPLPVDHGSGAGPACCRSDSDFTNSGGVGLGAGAGLLADPSRQRGLKFGSRSNQGSRSQLNTPGPGTYCASPQRAVTSHMRRSPVAKLHSTWKRYGLNTPDHARSHLVSEGTARTPLGEFTPDCAPRMGNPNCLTSQNSSVAQVRIGTAPARIAVEPSRTTDLYGNTKFSDNSPGPAKYNLSSVAGAAPITSNLRRTPSHPMGSNAKVPTDPSSRMEGDRRGIPGRCDTTSLMGPMGFSRGELPNQAPKHTIAMDSNTMSNQTCGVQSWARTWTDHVGGLRPATAPIDAVFPHSLGGGPGSWQQDRIRGQAVPKLMAPECDPLF